MFSVGLDMTSCQRMEAAARRPRFFERVFGPEEQALLWKRGYPQEGRARWVETAAASFCAKEAFGKLFGTGVRGFRLSEVELLREESGRPFLRLHGAAAEMAKGWEFSVSVTHVEEYAAVVIMGQQKDSH